MNIEAVLFDLDGTLLDTAPDFVRAVNQLRKEQDLLPLEAELIRTTVSDGARALIELSFQLKEGDEGFEYLKMRLLELYIDNICVDTVPFPGISELLHALADRDIHWGIVTNKPSTYTDPLLAAIQLVPAHATAICPDHVTKGKPDPEGLLLACQHINCSPGNTLYIGDHLRDIEAGLAAGMTTIAAGYGYIKEDDDANTWGAHHHVNHAKDIINIIDDLISD
jgi:phosphoglycolate phosphatase